MNPGGQGCSEPGSHHCTPGWAAEQDSAPRPKQGRKKYLWVDLIILLIGDDQKVMAAEPLPVSMGAWRVRPVVLILI